MMKIHCDIRSFVLLLTLVLTMAGCDDSVEIPEGQQVVAALAYSVSQRTTGDTRMSGNIVQSDGNYRGLQNVIIIPFSKRGIITTEDHPTAMGINISTSGWEKNESWFYFYPNCTFISGVASMLFYARAFKTNDKAENGSLIYEMNRASNPADITFRLEPMVSTSVANSDAQGIAAYLTRVAQTPGWSTTHDSNLKLLYENFINRGNVAALPIAGSAADVKVHLSTLYRHIDLLNYPVGSAENDIREAVMLKIRSEAGITFDNGTYDVTRLAGTQDNYPGNVGLPDGAAVLLWNGTQFVPQTETNTLAGITGITRYTYPAELFYYANSRIRTSNVDHREAYYTSEDTWSDVLSKYEYDNGVVSNNTKAVAIQQPIQYSVGCMQVGLNRTSATLTDAEGTVVTVTSSAFPLTGLIIGGQHTMGFDFTPQNPDDETDERFIYDNQLQTNNGDYFYLSADHAALGYTETLVLQTGDDKKVKVVAEFLNNSDKDFVGVGGIIYRGTKFYLMGEVVPKTEQEATYDYERRVFTQDRITKMGLTVNSLEKAYNVLPDLQSPRLEVGIQLITTWTAATPTNLEFE